MKKTRCEGYRRKNNFMTLGGRVEWVQCENDAIFNVTFVQHEDGEQKQTMPSCQECLDEAKRTSGIDVISVKKITKRKSSKK